jgi:hypothetical protein
MRPVIVSRSAYPERRVCITPAGAALQKERIMAGELRLVSAIFPHRTTAEEAYRALPGMGIEIDHVSFVGPKGTIRPASTGEVGHLTSDVREEKIPASGAVAAGAAVGGAIGILGGMLLAAGFLIIPAAGVAIAGPIVGALVGAGLAGSGTLHQALTGIGMSDVAARRIEDRIRLGHIVMAVSVPEEQAERVRGVLEKLGGEPVATEHVAGVQ